MKPVVNIVSRAGKQCKRCKACSDLKKHDVFHVTSKFWKNKKAASGLSSSCAAHYGKNKRTDRVRAMRRASYHRRKEKKTNAAARSPSWRKSGSYTTLLTPDAHEAQRILTTKWV